MRLSLPQHKKDLEAEASFEVFFGVRSVPATALQEAKITVKYAFEALCDDFYSLTLSVQRPTQQHIEALI